MEAKGFSLRREKETFFVFGQDGSWRRRRMPENSQPGRCHKNASFFVVVLSLRKQRCFVPKREKSIFIFRLSLENKRNACCTMANPAGRRLLSFPQQAGNISPSLTVSSFSAIFLHKHSHRNRILPPLLMHQTH